MNAFGKYLNSLNLGNISDFKLGGVKQRGLENKSFLLRSRDKALEKGLEDVVPQKLTLFVYNCMHFCIGVVTGIFFMGKQIQRVSFFLSFFFPFPVLLYFFVFFSILIFPYLVTFIFYRFLSFPWLKPQNSSYRDWGGVVSFSSWVWDRTPTKNQISCIRA